ncbi:MAG TPA: hypothetical protein DHV05_07295 [Acholeplasmataceae bacterium]|nr:hypothetical protein [Acholeplasmataceae bacterium]
MPVLVLIAAFLILNYIIQLDFDLITTIFLPLALGDLIFTLAMKNKISYYHMNVQYLAMLLEEEGPIKLRGRIFTASWINGLKDEGFQLAHDEKDHMLYYQFTRKLKGIPSSGDILLALVLAKEPDFKFYQEVLDVEMKRLYENEPKHFRTKKQIVLQFKRYDEFNDDSKDEISQIINFKNNQQYLIHITVGYFFDQNMVYFVCPKHRFPNKYYYFACRYIKQLCGIKIEE